MKVSVYYKVHTFDFKLPHDLEERSWSANYFYKYSAIKCNIFLIFLSS